MLLPLLTGLFAVPTLIQSFDAEIPVQSQKFRLPESDAIVRGTLSGFLVSLFPGISSGVATAFAAFRERSAERYIAAISSANTANAVLCLFVLVTMGKARSGAAEAILVTGYTPSYTEISLAAIVSATIAALSTLVASKTIVTILKRMSGMRISIFVLAFLLLLIYFLCGWFGLAVLFAASPVGMAAVLLRVKRVNCMGSLMVPVIMHYI